ncbi:lysylphosphatidylglycerol synthase domain-containing protein [Solimonas aquatica]|nr:lysylphosphatidylglycerol synthase domain-containing protein [Solimonas aquatica]
MQALTPALRQSLILLLVALAYIALVQWLCGWPKLLAAALQLSPLLLAGFLLLMLASYALRALRLYGSCEEIPRGHWGTSLRLLWLHNAANILMPARLGELSLPWLLRRRFGTSWTLGGSVLVWLRVLDLHCVAALTLIALMDLLPKQLATLALLGGAGLALLPFGLFLLRGRLLQIPRLHVIAASVPERLGVLLRELALTWAAWIAKLAAFTAVLQVLTGLPYAAAMLGAIGGDASTLLPFHAPAGAGTFEAGVMLGLSVLSNWNQSLAGAVTLHLLLLGTALGCALISLPELHKLQKQP